MAKTPERANEDRRRRRRSRGSGDRADWTAVDPIAVLGLIAAVAAAGGAVRFGYTRSGDAYAIGFLGDGDPYTEYLRPSDDVAGNLVDMTADWNGEAPA